MTVRLTYVAYTSDSLVTQIKNGDSREAAAKAADGWASEVRRLEAIIAAGIEVESVAPSEGSGEGAVVAALRAEVEALREQLTTAKTAGMSIQQLRSELSKRGLSPKGVQPMRRLRR